MTVTIFEKSVEGRRAFVAPTEQRSKTDIDRLASTLAAAVREVVHA